MFKTLAALALVAATSGAVLAREGVSTFDIGPRGPVLIEGRNSAAPANSGSEVNVERFAPNLQVVHEGRNSQDGYWGSTELGTTIR